ncbi:Maf family protein [Anaeromyxobacter diazotrophicus]|uniref:dTTP/UTP pyrophosphatase n=1 Tax=Anaeromyxobacter diazotrophicus TaxID=2590199 RepID=A0A7I9VPB5_9BACT|nr:Maf family protein [Anaeromyxobacter diazotrophicus]GEJ57969.1 Maf-like protein [Anaeromyxobacter diazotrophicus]
MTLTLASQSPRRRELLARLGLALDVRPADVDEGTRPGEEARAYVLRVAEAKARAVDAPGVVLAADTAVVLDGRILGKPRDDAEAAAMLRALSGRAHEVMTGVCARGAGRQELVAVTSAVELAALSERQIAWYVATGEPRDKAGAYAVQGVASAFVTAVRGSVSNVIGLPLAETLELLRGFGFPLPWDREAAG